MSDQCVALTRAEPTTLSITTDPDDEQFVNLWLNGRGAGTMRAYRRDCGRFFAFVRKPLRQVGLAEIQSFGQHLESLGLAPRSRHRTLSAVKSLFAFGLRLGYFPFDTTRPLRLPTARDGLTDRILNEAEVKAMIHCARTARDRLLMQLMYVAGVRVSEIAGLRWRDAIAHRSGGQITVFGKGAKTRTIRLEDPFWSSLIATRGAMPDEAPIFRSRKGGHLDTSQILRIVRAAARAAGIGKRVSPHWLRHCHASHALDHGAPIHLVQQTLGHSSVATTTRYLHARPSESSSRFLPSF